MKLLHGRVELALHPLSESAGEPLLLLHALGGRATDWSKELIAAWSGPVFGLDFAGHGDSGWSKGGYYPELYLANADLALERLGDQVVIAGAGVGAYVALLLAGARPNAVPAALLMPGVGFEGGGEAPNYADRPIATLEGYEGRIRNCALGYRDGTDPLVATCEYDLRPIDYVAPYAAAARCLLLSRNGIGGAEEPPWLLAVRDAASCHAAPAKPVEAIRRLHPSSDQ